MPTALEVARDVYRRFAEGDIAGFLNLCAEDIEWVVNGPATLEKCRAFRGRSGVQEFLDILGRTWEFSEFAPREFLADGSTVVVLGEEKGKDRKSAMPFENRWAHVFRVKDGHVVSFREFLCHWPGERKPPAMNWNPA
jgi:uncharacterized protein